MNEAIEQIREAEAKAAEKLEAAREYAAQITAAAETESIGLMARYAEEDKARREEQLKLARAQAERDYEATLAEKSAEAKEYADGLVKKAEQYVGEIIRRVFGGSC